jgi:hypothetical protein
VAVAMESWPSQWWQRSCPWGPALLDLGSRSARFSTDRTTLRYTSPQPHVEVIALGSRRQCQRVFIAPIPLAHSTLAFLQARICCDAAASWQRGMQRHQKGTVHRLPRHTRFARTICVALRFLPNPMLRVSVALPGLEILPCPRQSRVVWKNLQKPVENAAWEDHHLRLESHLPRAGDATTPTCRK